MTFPYLTSSGQFMLDLLGHEAISVYCIIDAKSEGGRLIVPKDRLMTELHMTGPKPLDRLQIADLVTISGRDTLSLSVNNPSIPHLKDFCQIISSLGKIMPMREWKSKGWYHLFQISHVENPSLVWRVGGKNVTSITLRNPAAVIVNGLTEFLPNGNYQSFAGAYDKVSGDQVSDVVCEHQIGKPVNHAPQPITIGGLAEPLRPKKKTWHEVSIHEWNTRHLADWIITAVEHATGHAAPFTTVQIHGLKNAVHQLWRKRHQSSQHQSPMEEFSHFVKWLIEHPKFFAVPTFLVSDKIMTIYASDAIRQIQTTASSVDDPFDM